MSSITRICKVVGCTKEYKGLGYCNKHYQRYNKNGTIKPKVIRNDDYKRFYSKVSKTRYCWDWIGQLNKDGYGKFFAKGKHISAHRYSYEMHNHTVLPSRSSYMCIDHICRNRACVNPNHLELVTYKENVKRGNIVKNRQSDLPIGIYFRERKEYKLNKPYEAKMVSKGRTYYLGNFETLDEAIEARNSF